MGFWGALIGAGATLLANKNSNDQSEQNTAQSYQNTRDLRQTAYQDTVNDLKNAGLNPMLAYQNSATPAAAMPVAQNRPVTDGVANSAMSIAQLSNVEAQNDLLEAQAKKAIAEAEAIPTSTANVAQQTENLKETIPKIQQEITELKSRVNLQGHQASLNYWQQELAKVDADLRKGQLTNVEAQTATQNIVTKLKNLEIPGAENLADYEKALATGAGNAATIGGKILDKIPAAGRIKGILSNSAKKGLK